MIAFIEWPAQLFGKEFANSCFASASNPDEYYYHGL